MCNCMDKLEEAYKKFGEEQGFEDMHIDYALDFKNNINYPRITASYRKKGKKRLYEQIVVPTYCPFCGKKYVEGE